MKSGFNPVLLNLAAILVAAGQSAYYFPRLPEHIASHFGPNGEANGWMDKGSFFVFYFVMLLGTAVIVGGIGWLFDKLPTEMINLPDKEYWLAPDRRASTLNTLRDQMAWFSVATLTLLIAMMQLTFQANLTAPPALDQRAMILVVAYLGYTLVWTAMLIYRFSVRR